MRCPVCWSFFFLSYHLRRVICCCCCSSRLVCVAVVCGLLCSAMDAYIIKKAIKCTPPSPLLSLSSCLSYGNYWNFNYISGNFLFSYFKNKLIIKIAQYRNYKNLRINKIKTDDFIFLFIFYFLFFLLNNFIILVILKMFFNYINWLKNYNFN